MELEKVIKNKNKFNFNHNEKEIYVNTKIINPTDEQNMGEIYKLTCLSNNKSYIGQALCFTTNKKWGTNERWKSHVREALGNPKDHCRLLNQAIRKYGYNNFSVECLIKCPIGELDIHETNSIKDHNTLVPSGYNLNHGGAKGKDSEETRIKKREMRVGKKHDADTKLYISLGQFGKKRKEDNLPQYIYKYRKEYAVRYPVIDIDKKEIKIVKYSFSGENGLNKAIDTAKNLEETHKTTELITKIKQDRENQMVLKRKNERNKKND